LSHFPHLGILDCIGWPLTYGGNPPFDGRAVFNGRFIPFDINVSHNRKSPKESACEEENKVIPLDK